MSDRELLELAAKAAGMDSVVIGAWNPLTDDGDALRLAVKLEFDICFMHGETVIDSMAVYVKHKKDSYAATRRAIVRAAAEIGKAMK